MLIILHIRLWKFCMCSNSVILRHRWHSQAVIIAMQSGDMTRNALTACILHQAAWMTASDTGFKWEGGRGRVCGVRERATLSKGLLTNARGCVKSEGVSSKTRASCLSENKNSKIPRHDRPKCVPPPPYLKPWWVSSFFRTITLIFHICFLLAALSLIDKFYDEMFTSQRLGWQRSD